jgi:glycosyltransferase involved in cell wall biosynthesis/SAM-dependent methyltransferase
MKILHVITGLSKGGAEAVLYRLTTSDDQNTHVVIALMDKGVYGERLISAGVLVYTLNMPRGQVTIKGVIKLYRLVRLMKPDVVQTWMYHADLIGGLVARFAGAKIVVWGIRGPFDKHRTSLHTRITIRLCAFLSKWVPIAIVSNSEHAAEVHLQAGYSPDKLVNIPNGYPLNKFRPDETARDELLYELNLKHDVVLIGMVARFDPYKDHENLFRALLTVARKGQQFICILVGPGMCMTNQPLVHLVEKYGIQDMVRLIGPRDDVPKIMAALDAHILSSAAESFPNVLAEAMACGTPCVTTDVGDAALIVGDTGWVVAHSDPAALAQAIQKAFVEMKDSGNWSIRKDAGRKRVIENYSLERMIVSFAKVWDGAINNNKANKNVDHAVVADFGNEWQTFDQSALSDAERKLQFDAYFAVFPWGKLSPDAIGFDAGCGSGRWAVLAAPKVGYLHCVDPSNAIDVARKNLRHLPNCSFHRNTVGDMPFPDNSMDFGYSLGVLHHIPDTQQGIIDCVNKLKLGAPLLVYIYYAFDNQPVWFGWLWKISDVARYFISKLPYDVKYALSQLIAVFVYFPLARTANGLQKMGVSVHSWPLSAYRDKSFYSMRTDALDRFGTKLEKRFTKLQILTMMENAGLEHVQFSLRTPFWCAVGYKK